LSESEKLSIRDYVLKVMVPKYSKYCLNITLKSSRPLHPPYLVVRLGKSHEGAIRFRLNSVLFLIFSVASENTQSKYYFIANKIKLTVDLCFVCESISAPSVKWGFIRTMRFIDGEDTNGLQTK